MFEFHHTGLLVQSIEDSLLHFTELFGQENISRVTEISSQKVKVCFIKTGPGANLELVEPVGEDSTVSKMLKQRISYYHVGYLVEDIEAGVRKMEALDYKPLTFFNSEAFDGKRCIFLFSPEGHLVELIEK